MAGTAGTTALAPLVTAYTPVDDALSGVTSKLRPKRRAESVPVLQAFGRVLSRDVPSPRDVPAFPTSHMDGIAIIASDVDSASQSNPVELNVVGAAGPGERPRRRINRGEALRVATGAALPEGADTVVPVENVEFRGDIAAVRSASERGSFVFSTGHDIRKGDFVLSAGQTVRAQDVALLMGLGYDRAQVWKRPSVAIIASGSELTSSSRPKAGKVRESHRPMFLRLCESAGCVPKDMGIVKDDPRQIARSLRMAIAMSDFVITLGGTSAGGRDLIVDAVSSLKPEALFHGIKMDRGRVSGVASVKGKPVLMLPGPIQAATSAFFILGTPLLGVLTGRERRGVELNCRLGKDWEGRARFTDFRKVVYVKLIPGAETTAEPLRGETESSMILARADGYFVAPEGVARMGAGDHVEVRLVPGFSYV